MKVLILNSVINGGGGLAAIRLQHALEYEGISSVVVTIERGCNREDVVTVDISAKEFFQIEKQKRFFYSHIEDNSQGHFYYYPIPAFFDHVYEIVKAIDFEPDAIIAGWVTGFCDAKTLYGLKRVYGAPILWYMADMQPMTGGCNYTFGCTKFKKMCYCCPAVKKGMKWLPILRQIKSKYYLKKAKAYIVCSSSYMFDLANTSYVMKELRKKLILRGFDEKVFRWANKKDARDEYGINKDDTVIFVGATSLSDKRKGFKFLIDAFNQLEQTLGKKENITILYAGNNNTVSELIPFNSCYVGLASTPEKLAKLYQCADVFVCTSLQDSGPMMVSESIMCGTPVIGFRTGVLPDVVLEGETGYLADVGDSNRLAELLLGFIELSEDEREELSLKCIRFARNNLFYHNQGRRFAELLRQLMNNSMYHRRNKLFNMKRKGDVERLYSEYLKIHDRNNIFKQWLSIRNRSIAFESYFSKRGIKKLAIYGKNDLCELLLMELDKTDISVEYIVDKSVTQDGRYGQYLIVGSESEWGKVDEIVITATHFYKEIANAIRAKTEMPFESLDVIIDDIYNSTRC